MKLKHVSLAIAGIAAAAISLSAVAQKKYDTGATDTEIKIGDTKPYSGPASAYGTIGKAIAAYFDKVNAEGGINGRKIKFISLDDGYNPAKTVEQVRKLVEEDEVLFVFNPLGTPSNTRDPQVHESEEGAAAVRGHRRHQVGRPEELPVDDGLAAQLPERRQASTRSTSWRPTRTPRSACSTRTTTTARTISRASKDGLGDKAKTMIVSKVTLRGHRPDGRQPDGHRSRPRAPTPSSTSRRRSSPRRRSRRPPRSAGSPRTT